MLLEVAILLLCTEQLFTAINLFGCMTFSRVSHRRVVNPAKLGNLSALNAIEKVLCDFFSFLVIYMSLKIFCWVGILTQSSSTIIDYNAMGLKDEKLAL